MPTAEQANRKRKSGITLRLDLKPTIRKLPGSRFRDGQHFTAARAVEGRNPESYSMCGRVIVNGEDTYIEVKPQPDWFEIRTIRGRDRVYLKFQCTGLETIYYGPHDTKEEALLTLDKILAGSMDALLNA